MRLLPIPGVFQPISDSWLLAESLAAERVCPGRSVLDLCTGSGVLAITAAQLGAAPVVALDISRRAVLAATLNARLNGVAITALRGDLFSGVEERRFDVIVSNPPYVPGERPVTAGGASRAWEAGPRGRAFLDPICAQVAGRLNPGGTVLLTHSAMCDEQETLDTLRAHGLDASVVVRRRGPLGPRMSERSSWLRSHGLLSGAAHEDVVVVRGRLPAISRA